LSKPWDSIGILSIWYGFSSLHSFICG